MKRIAIALAGLLIAIQTSLIALGVALKLRARPAGEPTEDEVAISAVFGEQKVRNDSETFSGGSSLVYMGAAEIDLTDATPDALGAHLDVRTIFGATEIYVPEGWRVSVRSNVIAGDVENLAAGHGLPEDAPELEIDALTICGSLEVISGPRGEGR